MEIEDNSCACVSKITLHKCPWVEELNKWIRKSIPKENRKVILKYKNKRLYNSKVYIILQDKCIQQYQFSVIFFLLNFEHNKKFFRHPETKSKCLIIENKNRQASVFSRVTFKLEDNGAMSTKLQRKRNLIPKYYIQARFDSYIKTTNR